MLDLTDAAISSFFDAVKTSARQNIFMVGYYLGMGEYGEAGAALVPFVLSLKSVKAEVIRFVQKTCGNTAAAGIGQALAKSGSNDLRACG